MHRSGPPSLEDEPLLTSTAPRTSSPWRPARVPDWKNPEPGQVTEPQQRKRSTGAGVADSAATTTSFLMPSSSTRENAEESLSGHALTNGAVTTGKEQVLSRVVVPERGQLPSIPPPPTASPFSKASPIAEERPLSATTHVDHAPHPEEPKEETDAANALARFLQFRQQSAEFHDKIRWSFDQIATLESRHEAEATAYREATGAKLAQQQKLLEEAQQEAHQAQASLKNLQEQLDATRRRVTALEQECYQRNVHVAHLEQARKHAEDRARVAEVGRSIAEVRQKEAEAASEQLSKYAEMLRVKVTDAHKDRDAALLRQYKAFEENRKELIMFFDKREASVVESLNEVAEQVYATAQAAAMRRLDEGVAQWRSLYEKLQAQYRDLEQSLERRRQEAEREWQGKQARLEAEAARQQQALRAEMECLSDAMRKREETLARTAASREAELQAREQRIREERAAYEENCAAVLRKKEADLKAQHEASLVAAKEAFEKDRERLMETFSDQLQKIANMHLNNERELERLHREKEREMGQRYRLTNTKAEERESNANLHDAAFKSQEALLSSFDSIETNQRARAEQLKAQMKAAAPPPSTF